MISKQELTKWAEAADCLWLFLDYDGTLDDFAPTPFDVSPNPEIIHILEDLTSKPYIRVTILSGRGLGQVRQLIPIQGIFLAGSYGIEILTPEQDTIHRVDFESIRPFLDNIKPRWSSLINGKRGFFLEDKGWTLAIHARFADENETERVLQEAREIEAVQSLSEQFRIVGGHKFLEIAPRLASKRETVKHMLQAFPLDNAQLLYIGDDDKDEDAFSIIHDHNGIAVKVLQASQRSHPTQADVFFANPQETLGWLSELV